jgi:hypothetical protein
LGRSDSVVSLLNRQLKPVSQADGKRFCRRNAIIRMIEYASNKFWHSPSGLNKPGHERRPCIGQREAAAQHLFVAVAKWLDGILVEKTRRTKEDRLQKLLNKPGVEADTFFDQHVASLKEYYEREIGEGGSETP